jgi:hypothetical protein
MGAGSARAFLDAHRPAVRASLRHLDMIVFLPVADEGPVAPRVGENQGFRALVDEALRRALLDDDLDLFEGEDAPTVVELPPLPDRQLAELIRLVRAGASR